MIAAAALALASAWNLWGAPSRPDLVVLFGVCVAVGELRRIYLPSGEATSSGGVFALAAAWLLNPVGAALVELLGWTLSALYEGSLTLGRWFNAAQTTLAALAAGICFAAAGGVPGTLPTAAPGGAYLAGGIAFTAVNSGLVAVALALHRRQPVLPELAATYRAHVWRSFFFIVASLVVVELFLRCGWVTLVWFGAVVLGLEVLLRYTRDHEFRRIEREIGRLLPVRGAERRQADRLVRYTEAFSRYLGLPAETLRDLRFAAMLSEAGCAGVPRPGGGDTGRVPALVRAAQEIGRALVLANVARIVRHRDEAWDGTGSPDGLRGEAIPYGARILAVVRAFDTLTTGGAGHPPVGIRAAIKALEERRGRDLDPKVTDRFVDFLLEHEAELRGLIGKVAAGREERLAHLVHSLREAVTHPGGVPQSPKDTAAGAGNPALLLRLNAVLTETLSLSDIYDRIADVLAGAVGQPAWVASYEGWGAFLIRVARGVRGNPAGPFGGDPGPMLGAVTRLWVVEQAVDVRGGPWADLLPPGKWWVAAAPMIARGRVVGALCAARAHPERFAPADLDLLEVIAGPAALAVDNARLHEETRRRLAELSSLKRFTDQILDRMPVAVLTFGADGRVRLINAAARQFLAELGLEAGRLERLPLRAWVHLHPAWAVFRSALADEEEYRDPALEVNLGGARRWFDAHVAPVHGPDGSVIAAVGVAREVTDRQMLERQILEAERLAAVGQLAAGAAHEIRNPLTAIKGFIQLMHEELEDEHENLELVLAEIDRIERLVNDLLLMARPSVLETAPCDVNRLVEKVAVLLSAQAGQQGVRIECDLDPALPAVEADSRQLRQVLFNLASNAIEAMPDGGILRFETSPARTDGRRQVVLRVSDTGTGIARTDLARIFEPFFTTKARGTGLGLAVVYSIIRNHQGTIDVETEEGRGTTFTVRLPVDGRAPQGDVPEV